MGNAVNISDLMEAIDFASEETHQFVNVKTGNIAVVFSSTLRKAEEDAPHDETIGWHQDERQLADAIMEDVSDTYLPLPEQYELNEYRMMEDFIYTLEDKKKQDVLARAIDGKGAFRRFKDRVIDLDVAENWYNYRDEKHREFAVEWCESNGIAYKDDAKI